MRLDRRRRPILLALALALAATLSVLGVVALTRSGAGATTDPTLVAKGQPAPPITGTTLDGAPFDLATLRGRPVIVNFWGPQCIPCRDEFPLFKAKLTEHVADGLAVVGVLTDNGPDAARTFVAEQGATWPTVIDPGGALKRSYRVLGLPQSYFIDRTGVVRSIQVGWLQAADFERQFGLISGGS